MKDRRTIAAVLTVVLVCVSAVYAQVGDVTEHVAIIGDSSSGAVVTHVTPGAVTRIMVVSPYHYYRAPMDSVEAFSNTGDDSPIVPEVGTTAVCEIVSEPAAVNDSTWTVAVRAPDVPGNWIATFRTVGVAYESHGVKYGKRPRTVQLRLTTKQPIEEYAAGL